MSMAPNERVRWRCSGDADALIVRSETRSPRSHARRPEAAVVARAGVGVDNVDLEAATRAGVLVLNAPGANRISAGEHTIALLLAITRQIPHANESTQAGRWERKKIKPIDCRPHRRHRRAWAGSAESSPSDCRRSR